MAKCEHLREVIDEHEGSIICVDCGLVKDRHFTDNISRNSTWQNRHLSTTKCLSSVILDKMNFPESYANLIEKNLSDAGKNKQNLKTVALEIYEKIIEESDTLALKTLMNISGLKSRHFKCGKKSVQ